MLSNNYARVYLYNGIFMQLAVAIMLIKLFNKDRNIFGIVKLAILLVGIYVSNTRGFCRDFRSTNLIICLLFMEI